MNRYIGSPTRKCRNLIVSSRVRRQGMAEKLNALWQEIYRHATIEQAPKKLSPLIAKVEKRKNPTETVLPRQSNSNITDLWV